MSNTVSLFPVKQILIRKPNVSHLYLRVVRCNGGYVTCQIWRKWPPQSNVQLFSQIFSVCLQNMSTSSVDIRSYCSAICKAPGGHSKYKLRVTAHEEQTLVLFLSMSSWRNCDGLDFANLFPQSLREAGRKVETASVLAAIFTARYWQAPCSTSCDRIATHVANITTHVATSSAL
jgi:hypothetical protein